MKTIKEKKKFKEFFGEGNKEQWRQNHRLQNYYYKCNTQWKKSKKFCVDDGFSNEKKSIAALYIDAKDFHFFSEFASVVRFFVSEIVERI